jgi:hypothetical protein
MTGPMTSEGFNHMHFCVEQILNEAGLTRHSKHRFFIHTPNVLRHQIGLTESGKKRAYLRRELRRAEKYLAKMHLAAVLSVRSDIANNRFEIPVENWGLEAPQSCEQ